MLSAGLLFSDRIEALLDGRVSPAGAPLAIRCMEAQALFRSVLRDAAWDVAELSMGSHIAAVAAGRRDYLGLPVFPSRSFRHGNLYVRTDRVRTPEDLKGKTIGVIDFQQTAALWVRGLLADEHGVERRAVRWVAAGLHAPALTDRAPLDLPPEIECDRVPETLDDLLRHGKIDAVISPTAPRCFSDPAVPVDRMWPDFADAQVRWWQRTRLFPIMHILVVRRSLAEADPALPAALLAAFDEARALALHDLATRDFPKLALPSQFADAMAARASYGDDLWTYGIEPNRAVLKRMLNHAEADGLSRSGLVPEDLFA